MAPQAEKIWHNGELIHWHDCKVHIMTHSLHYGTSLFEGIRCYDTPNGPAIFRHKEHMRRLINSAKIYQFRLDYSLEQLMVACRETLRANQLTNAYIRPLAYFGDIGLGVCIAPDTPMELMVAAFPWGAYLGEEALEQGIDAMVSSWARVASNTIPTGAKAGGNYLSSLLIGSEARRLGYSEGIALDVRGRISEGAAENIFVIQNGIIHTPPLTSSILPGITRDTLMTLAKEAGYAVREESMSRESLYLADEIFMTGTAVEVTPVRSVDGRQVGCGHRGPITEVLQRQFFGLFNGSTEDKWDWLDYLNPREN